jgi:hypothetical protein
MEAAIEKLISMKVIDRGCFGKSVCLRVVCSNGEKATAEVTEVDLGRDMKFARLNGYLIPISNRIVESCCLALNYYR